MLLKTYRIWLIPNNVLQGDLKQPHKYRIAVNTTIGILGTIDVNKMGFQNM